MKKARQGFQDLQEQVKHDVQTFRQRVLRLLHPDVRRPTDWHAITIQQPAIFYKVVTARDGQLVSLHDSDTTFQLRKWVLAKHGGLSWPPLYACLFGFVTPEQALTILMQDARHLPKAPKVLMQFEAVGPAYQLQGSAVYAFSRIRPLRVLTQLTNADPLDVHYALNPPASILSGQQPEPSLSAPNSSGPDHLLLAERPIKASAARLTHAANLPKPAVRTGGLVDRPSWSPAGRRPSTSHTVL